MVMSISCPLLLKPFWTVSLPSSVVYVIGRFAGVDHSTSDLMLSLCLPAVQADMIPPWLIPNRSIRLLSTNDCFFLYTVTLLLHLKFDW